MRAIVRRIQELEWTLGFRPETAEDRRLRERWEAAQRRMAELDPSYQWPRRNGAASVRHSGSPLSIVEILHAGRLRARNAAIDQEVAKSPAETT